MYDWQTCRITSWSRYKNGFSTEGRHIIICKLNPVVSSEKFEYGTFHEIMAECVIKKKNHTHQNT